MESLVSQREGDIELRRKLYNFAQCRGIAETLLRRRHCTEPAGAALETDARIQGGLSNIVTMLQTDAPRGSATALHFNFRIINVIF